MFSKDLHRVIDMFQVVSDRQYLERAMISQGRCNHEEGVIELGLLAGGAILTVFSSDADRSGGCKSRATGTSYQQPHPAIAISEQILTRGKRLETRKTIFRSELLS